jgi:ubiquitin carboxyl-terminal hydrolase L5
MMEGSSNNWCTIESDPGVFTSLIESFGVKNAQLTELWSLDDDTLEQLIKDYGNVYGLIFLFKWQQGGEGSSSSDSAFGGKPLSDDETPNDLFFAKQVTTNACATQALLSILLNSKTNDGGGGGSSSLELGETLSNLKSFTTGRPSDLKGESIGSCEEIRTAHNSFARKEAFLMDESQKRVAGENEDVFHFIAYVPHSSGGDGGGIVYELDGLQSGPIQIGKDGESSKDGNDSEWLKVARTAIQSRIEKYAATEIKFNLMALTQDKRIHIQSKLEKCDSESEQQQYHMELANEEEQRQQWKMENERRRHNYVPFCVELIRALAGSGKLPELTKEAKERTEVMRKKKMGNGKM